MQPWVPPLELETDDLKLREMYGQLQKDTGSVTNMKRTLARSPVALRVYMEWYALKKECGFLSEKLFVLFCYAISTASHCPVCSSYFTRAIAKAGYDIEELARLEDEKFRKANYDEKERAIIEFGYAFAINQGKVVPAIMRQLKECFDDREIVNLVAFAGIMVATNLFNNALEVEVEEFPAIDSGGKK